MRDNKTEQQDRDRTAMRSNIAMLCFGLAILTYLIAIDRTEWFHLRPASGTAIAISKASGHDRTEAARGADTDSRAPNAGNSAAAD